MDAAQIEIRVEEAWQRYHIWGGFPAPGIPTPPFERLERVRTRLMEILPSLVSKEQVVVVSVHGELWSPRKM